MEEERLVGTIRMWRPDKKFGFVFSPEADVEFFLHESDLPATNLPRILVGHVVEFSPTQSEQGFRAEDARFLSDISVVD